VRLSAVAGALGVVLLLAIALRAAPHAAEAGSSASSVRGLPHFSAEPPFRPFDEAAGRALREALLAAAETRTSCPRVEPGPASPPPRGNICHAPDAARLRDVLAGVGPSLDPARMALWKVDVDPDASPELLVACSPVAGGPDPGDPHLALWLLRPAGERYESRYAGAYRHGQVHAITRFGPSPREKVLFVKSRGGAGCEAWVVLHAISFADTEAVTLFELTYAPDHATWHPVIRYADPRSAGTTVDTRLLRDQHRDTPHMIQLFQSAGAPAEWWLFRCAGRRCDYQRHAERLPGRWLRAWLKGQRL